MPINLYFFHFYFYLHKCKQFLSKLGARPGTWFSPKKIYCRGQNSQKSPKNGNMPPPINIDP